MASKLTCPKCKKVLRIDYDIDKAARGIYTVIDKPDGKRVIRCELCKHIGTVRAFDGF